MKHLFPSLYRLYQDDADLLTSLGVEITATEFDHMEWVPVATITTEHCPQFQDGTTVTVEVCMAPANFWRFTIHSETEDVQNGTLTTGSGSLTQYWNTVRDWAGGALGFKPDTK